MKIKDNRLRLPNEEEIAKAAPMAMAGLADGSFWNDVDNQLAKQSEAKKSLVAPRPVLKPR
jgi:hypothetical protein